MRFSSRKWMGVVSAGLLATSAAVARSESDLGAREITLSTADEPLRLSTALRMKMGETRDRISRLSERAARDKDIVKLNCVNDKKAKVFGHLVIADEALEALKTALAHGDDGERAHEHSRITILYEKVNVLETEAEGCIGEDVSYVGPAAQSVEIDPSVPEEDPTEPVIPLPDVTRPPPASPFV
jgi:hypothetical protein